MFFTLISGTNRLQSSTRKLSSHIENIFRRFLTPTDQIEILDLASLPAETFHPDSYVHTPKSFSKFSDLVLKANGIFSVVPEYNGSAPGAFKYFVDLLPFPKALLHKPSGFVGLSAEPLYSGTTEKIPLAFKTRSENFENDLGV
jgi:NAD(P)H-dependent FMN reductase